MKQVPFTKFRAVGSNLQGAPSIIYGDFICSSNNLTSLEGAPEHIQMRFECSRNNLKSLHNIHKHIKFIGEFALFFENPISECVLGLLMIQGLKKVWFDNKELQDIIKTS